MSAPNQTIFRKNALRNYMQAGDKAAYPRFVPLPWTIILWLLLGLLTLTCLVTWNQRVPVYTSARGIMLGDSIAGNGSTIPANIKDAVVLFIPANRIADIHSGLPVHLHVAAIAEQVHGKVMNVLSGALSPTQIQENYRLQGSTIVLDQPSIAVVVSIDKQIAQNYAGAPISADIEVGQERLIAFLPIIGNFFSS